MLQLPSYGLFQSLYLKFSELAIIPLSRTEIAYTASTFELSSVLKQEKKVKNIITWNSLSFIQKN